MNTTTKIIQPPTPEILAACEGVERIIRAYLKGTKSWRASRRFEAPVEVYTHLKLLIRLSEAILVLARNDLVLVPAAMTIARSLLETGYRAAWLLAPVDPYEREARWVLYLETAATHHKKLATEKMLTDERRAYHSKTAAYFRQFSMEIRRLLKNEGYEVKKLFPNFRQLVNEQDLPDAYHLFIELSAATHSNFSAMDIYHKNLGTIKQFGEFVGPKDWFLPIGVSGLILFWIANKLLHENEVDVNNHFPKSLQDDFQKLLQNIV
jgi:hypothetical protein